jgi:hypothetical protein
MSLDEITIQASSYIPNDVDFMYILTLLFYFGNNASLC